MSASLQSGSEHPLARALVRYAKSQGLPVAAPDSFTSHSGQGVSGDVEGRQVLIGNRSLLASQNIAVSDLDALYEGAENHTVSYIAVDGMPAAVHGMRRSYS